MIGTHSRRTTSLLAGSAVALSMAALAGCASVAPAPPGSRPDIGGEGSHHDPTGPVTPAPAPGPGTDPTAPGGPVEEDVDGAVDVVDTYWSQHWSDTFEGSYESPQVAGFYNGTSGPACGGRPSSPNNAFYCPEGDFVAWDSAFMANGYASGDTFVYVVVAHEWGHAIQNRIDPSLVPAADELQADCFAGAVLEGAVEDGTLSMETGDVDEIVVAFDALGDDQPWTDSSSHGTSEQRLAAFKLGVDNGVSGCLASS